MSQSIAISQSTSLTIVGPPAATSLSASIDVETIGVEKETTYTTHTFAIFVTISTTARLESLTTPSSSNSTTISSQSVHTEPSLPAPATETYIPATSTETATLLTSPPSQNNLQSRPSGLSVKCIIGVVLGTIAASCFLTLLFLHMYHGRKYRKRRGVEATSGREEGLMSTFSAGATTQSHNRDSPMTERSSNTLVGKASRRQQPQPVYEMPAENESEDRQ